ncbi:CaiB/BaiF CoA transferase family protein [Kocuria marina]|uniref:Crotonobetainyl-CoA:carnitine CoA-transferase CaiB n=1 Tax=Kocuria marina subsp. indica TaxID=1049583 RepID=A0A1X7CDI1_9MICC|nr:CoA transferase [Kocuria indica]OXS85508.1 carnitine dehydratase [Kocuria indica]RLP58963.1 CoA transferase [Kocuria indica]SME94476.1 Crotonobetainyl-CoA:carnitine CoA-transferase CaiB [Kocuria indica]
MSLTQDPATSGPLSGVVVADFSRVLAGPYCTMLLADMGATVVKVESPTGDDTRGYKPPSRDGVGTYYLSVNRNKHSIVLDLRDPADLETAYEIIDAADVFIENFKPGGLARYGLDPEAVAEGWPGLIHTSITGFGTDRGAHLPGYDLLVQGVSGFMSVTGSADGPPQRAGVAMFDVLTGLHAAVAILGALHERDVSGRGQHIHLDLLSCALSSLVNQTTGYAACGNDPQRMGNDHPSLFPYGPFPTADKDLIITVGNNPQFRRFVTVLGLPELAEDPRFDTVENRNQHREELRPLLNKALSSNTAEVWASRLQSEGLPCAPILTIPEGVEYAASLGLDPVVQVGEGDEAVPLIKNPVTFSRTPVRYDKAPPALGADRTDVMAWLRSRRAAHDDAPAPDRAAVGAVPAAAHDGAAGSPGAAPNRA